MCLLTLHDRVRNLGLGAMYEHHWGAGGEFADLFDIGSAEWASSPIERKIIDLQAFESAGVSVAELLENYRQTITQRPATMNRIDNLPRTIAAYRDAGFAPPVPEEMMRPCRIP